MLLQYTHIYTYTYTYNTLVSDIESQNHKYKETTMGNKAAKKKKIAEAAKLAKANAAAAKEQQKPEVTNEKVVEIANVDEISAEPVVVTPPRKKEPIAIDLVAVKKAVDASSTVQEARRIAREAKEQASRASVTAEAIIKETQDIINKDNNTAEESNTAEDNNKAENKNDDDNNSDSNNSSSTTMKTTLPVGHTSYSWISKDSDDVPFGHTKFSFSGKLVAAC